MKKAFTLIELLVVIAIIAILAAILFPVFAQAKEAAKKTSCLSNNKQIATSLHIYAADADDTLCQTSWEQALTPNPNNPAARQVHWTYLMQPYIKNYDMFVCPSDPTPVTPKTPCTSIAQFGQYPQTCDWQAPKYSYIPNYNLMPAHDWIPSTMTIIPYPADTIMVAERRNKLDNGLVIGQQKGVSGFNPSQPCNNWTFALSANPPAGTYSYVIDSNQAKSHLNDATDKFDIIRVKWDRHTEGANYSFADGHAKFKKLDQTLDPNKYAYGERWYPQFAPYNTSPCN